MDCRKFRNSLEDYLQGDLDFTGRFGMERHAQQCVHCGHEVADAQKIKELVRGLNHVKAPPGFEAGVLAGIRSRNIRRRRFWQYWEYGLERLSWRSAAVAVSAAGLLVLAFIAGTQWLPESPEEIAEQTVAPVPAVPAQQESAPPPAPSLARPMPSARPVARFSGPLGFEPVIRVEPADPGFVEFLVPGPGDRRMIMRLPKAVRMQYETSSEEYFIRNVSH